MVSTKRDRAGMLACFMREHHVVVERLAVALDQHVVGRQPGAADAEAGLADHVAQLVEQRAVEALGLRDRVEVAAEGGHDLRAAPRSRRVADVLGEPAHAPSQDGHLVEQVGPSQHASALQRDQHRAVGVVEGEREVVVVSVPA